MATIREALAVALDHHLAGRRLEAETLYRRILDADTGNPDALHLLGVLCAQTGRTEEAIRHLTAAVAGTPAVPDYHVNLGNALQVAGRFDEAAGCHRAALERAPGRADAGFGLAVALAAAGRRDEEAAALDAHLRHHPGHAEAWTRLGLALRALGRVEDAIAPLTEAARRAPLDAGVQANLGLTLLALGHAALPVFRRALALDPAFARVLAAVAEEAERDGEPARAERFHRRALRLDPGRAASQAALARLRRDAPDAVAQRRRALVLSPDDVDGWNEQGLLDRRAARMAAAAVALRRALRLRPELAALRSNLAVTLRALGQPESALLQARLAVALDPGDAAIAGNLAMAFETMDQPAVAALWIGRGLRGSPQDAAGWAYRGAMLRRSGRIADGLAAGERAVALEPGGLGGWQNRAAILQDLGRTGAGIAANRRALVLDPAASGLHSNLLLALHYSPDIGPMELLEEHRRWDARHGRPLAPPAGFRHPNRPDPDRRLRVGYVSADFGYHPVGYFLAPVLPAHDRAAVEVFCYNVKPREDGMTRRLRAAADQWRSLCGVDDEAAAAMIAADGIDILVDLAGHTAGNRLPLFARKPAPLQVTWAGYVGTTGLSTMDALIACPRQMPPGSEATAVERVLRLPDDYVCVLPRENAPAVGPLPARTNGFVTFGCFNNRAKLSGPTLSLWARLLARVRDARLLLKTHQFDDPVVRAGLLAEFAAAGGDPERVDFSGTARHFDLPDWYNRIDVALDPFPYSGGLTTLEALWMGVPVVTLGGGDRFCARHSVAHLTAAGLPELIAGSPDGYLAIAAGLAADRNRLAALRAGLRDRMAAGPLCDGPRFTRHLEAAYRDLWRDWCAA